MKLSRMPADDRPLRHPEDQARSDQGRDGEEVQVAAEPAMVAFLGLFDLGDVGLQVLLVEERGAVDALKHLAVGWPFQYAPAIESSLNAPTLPAWGMCGPRHRSTNSPWR